MQDPAGHGEDIRFSSNCSGVPLTVFRVESDMISFLF